ncbi:MAG: N-acetylgalactosamine-6-sulfatase, partial [Lentisphaeraceae bacterium]|nr:N-acetylgalactosamine-6-sulfatase [Lentisphaeraceae bacterium]
MSSDGRWKLHLPHRYREVKKPGVDGADGKYSYKKIALSLFDMKNDPFEKVNVLEKYPDIAVELQKFAEKHRAKFWSKK